MQCKEAECIWIYRGTGKNGEHHPATSILNSYNRCRRIVKKAFSHTGYPHLQNNIVFVIDPGLKNFFSN